MLSARFLTRRRLWIVLAVVICLGSAALSFFWMVFHHPNWLVDSFGTEILPLMNRCVAARSAMPAIDRDGDGFPDWYEEWLAADPQNARSVPAVILRSLSMPNVGFLNERMHIRLGATYDGPFEYHWPPGYRLNVQATAPVLLRPGGEGTPVAGPLELVANAEGCFEFDAQLDAATAHRGGVGLQFSRAATGDIVRGDSKETQVLDFVGYRLPPLPTTTRWDTPQERIRDPRRASSADLAREFDPAGELAWPLLPDALLIPWLAPPLPPVWLDGMGTNYSYMLEGARADRAKENEWRILMVVAPTERADGRARRPIWRGDVRAAHFIFADEGARFVFRIVPIAPRED